MSKNQQKILGCRFRRADSRNIAFVVFYGKNLELFALKTNSFQNPKFYNIPAVDFGKIIGIIKEMQPKVTSGGQKYKVHKQMSLVK